MKLLITGAAGFIGYSLASYLRGSNFELVGLDIINNYYEVALKYGRLREMGIEQANIEYARLVKSNTIPNYRFVKLDLCDKEAVDKLFKEEKFDYVCHLAAQAGVRYSITNPTAYIKSNIIAFHHILEACRHNFIKHLIFASSSSVYGLNKSVPFSVEDNVDHPISYYAATKKSNELMAHSYSHLYGIPMTGLRFFTVYGPWGRPDMAFFKFTKAIFEGKTIEIYNHGKMKRDFTYIDDIVESLSRLIKKAPEINTDWDGKAPNPSSSSAPYRLYNIGNNSSIPLMDFISNIEKSTGKKAKKKFLPIQKGDVEETFADVSHLIEMVNFKPKTSIQEGIENFVKWYREYFQIKN